MLQRAHDINKETKHHNSATEVKNDLMWCSVEGWGRVGKQRACVDFSFKQLIVQATDCRMVFQYLSVLGGFGGAVLSSWMGEAQI